MGVRPERRRRERDDADGRAGAGDGCGERGEVGGFLGRRCECEGSEGEGAAEAAERARACFGGIGVHGGVYGIVLGDTRGLEKCRGRYRDVKIS